MYLEESFKDGSEQINKHLNLYSLKLEIDTYTHPFLSLETKQKTLFGNIASGLWNTISFYSDSTTWYHFFKGN